MAIEYSVATLVAVHTALLGVIDAEGVGAHLNLYSAADTLLSTLPFDYPSGTVNGTTGQLAMAFGARDEAAAASGEASYGAVYNADDTLVVDNIPVQESAIAVSGYITMPDTTIVSGQPVEGVTFTWG